jgi:hypothetical protein
MRPTIYKKRPPIKDVKVVDAHSGALEELFFIQNPYRKKGEKQTNDQLANFKAHNKLTATWIHYPKEKVLVKTLAEKHFFELRTSRNKNLITKLEQQNFRNLSVGIAGLSVGSCVLATLVVSGGPKKIKIADFDTLELTNLNRIRATLLDIGKSKVEIAAREVWRLDPFAELTLFDKGLDEHNLKNFLLGKPKLNIFIDEMDNIPLKIQARFLCKSHNIPVIMATDNGDSVLLDIERYDLEPTRKIFHGLLPQIEKINLQTLTHKTWLTLATKIIGPEFLTPAMQASLLEIGKIIPAVPQLGSTAGMAGAAVCLALRRIANGQNMPSGRYHISLEEKLIPKYLAPKAVKHRKKQTEKFQLNFGT